MKTLCTFVRIFKLVHLLLVILASNLFLILFPQAPNHRTRGDTPLAFTYLISAFLLDSITNTIVIWSILVTLVESRLGCLEAPHQVIGFLSDIFVSAGSHHTRGVKLQKVVAIAIVFLQLPLFLLDRH